MQPSEPTSAIPPHDAAPPRTRPSRAWYALTVIPPLIAVIVVIRAVMGILDTVDDMKRVIVPGVSELELESGDHVIYGETDSVMDGVGYHSSTLDLRCRLADATTDQPLALEGSGARTTYSFGAHTGESLWTVNVPRAGRYRITCEGADNDKGVLAIGRGIGLVWTVIQVLLSVFLALPLMGLIGWRVSKARKL